MNICSCQVIIMQQELCGVTEITGLTEVSVGFGKSDVWGFDGRVQ